MNPKDFLTKWMMGSFGPSVITIFELTKILVKKELPDISEWDLDEKAEIRSNMMREELIKEYNNSISDNIPPFFSFSIQYSEVKNVSLFRYDNRNWEYSNNPFIKSKPEIIGRIKNIDIILKSMNKLDACDSISFEIFCAELFNSQGYDLTLPKKRKKEGGCDFYGYSFQEKPKRIIKPMPSHYVGLHGTIKYRVFGQTKRQSSNVGEYASRLFKSQFEDLKKGTGTAIKVLPSDFLKSSLPLIGVICTNADFSVNAKNILKSTEIITRKGIQLAWDMIFYFDNWFENGTKFKKQEFIDFFNKKAKIFSKKVVPLK